MRLRWQHDLSRGQKRGVAKRKRAVADLDSRVLAAIAAGTPADARALEARLQISYWAARRALKRQNLWVKSLPAGL